MAFDFTLRDAQSTAVAPIAPERFDYAAYADYEAALLPRCLAFQAAESGLLVHRRFRAEGVFYDRCADFDASLGLQLGALTASRAYAGDVPNFLEPWYGYGLIVSAFGGDYVWQRNQAPAVLPRFQSAGELLAADFCPLQHSPIGRRNLEMAECFLDRTHGRLPMSLPDLSSPLDMLSYLLPTDALFLELYDDPDAVRAAALLIADLEIDYIKALLPLIGSCLASPGHGFASCRAFSGIALSHDVSVMVSDALYRDCFLEADERIGAAFSGNCYHSCGNWGQKLDLVRSIPGLRAADAAFGSQTDPAPNDPETFGAALAGTGIALNARAVGSAEESFSAFSQLYRTGLKLIAVSYCDTPEAQRTLYDRLHALSNGPAAQPLP